MIEFNEDLLIQAHLSDYKKCNIKVVDKWNDRSGTRCQDGANNAIIELENGSCIKIVYMYEDCLWMPE